MAAKPAGERAAGELPGIVAERTLRADRHVTLAFVLFGRSSVFGILYFVVGVAVAAAYDYFDRLSTASRVLTAVAAVFLWPVVAVGFDIRITR